MPSFCNFKILRQINAKPRFLDPSFESGNHGMDEGG